MELYLIRHGESAGEAPGDAGPALSSQGLEQVQKMSAHVLELASRPEVLYSSPLLRASQTADPFSHLWQLPIQIVDWLLPGVSPSQVLQQLRELRHERWALVGHLPSLGLLLGVLAWGLPPKEIVIPRGGVAYLQMKSWDPGTAKLKWLVSPDVFS